jgi:membrane-associated phospholipid phosphatase
VKTLLMRTAAAWLLGTVMVVLCYGYVDRPVARFVHDHQIVDASLREWPSRISYGLTILIALGIAGVVLWRIVCRGGRVQTVLLALSVSLIVTSLLKSLLKWGFGRPWPEVWLYFNPTGLGSQGYGFCPFHLSKQHMAFPSGHSAVVFSVLPILWVACPRWRWLWVLITASMCTGLIGLDFHFVGDVIAGIMLGSTTGVFVARGFRLSPLSPLAEGVERG